MGLMVQVAEIDLDPVHPQIWPFLMLIISLLCRNVYQEIPLE